MRAARRQQSRHCAKRSSSGFSPGATRSVARAFYKYAGRPVILTDGKRGVKQQPTRSPSTPACPTASVCTCSGIPYRFSPLGNLGLDERAELATRITDRLERHGGKALLRLPRVDDAHDLEVELLQDRLGRP